MTSNAATEIAVLGGGCFWCTEAVYLELRGVTKVESGYSGGQQPDPTYEQVCAGTTGHAEVVRLEFDPAVVYYRDLLEIFFTVHDPTTLNRQATTSARNTAPSSTTSRPSRRRRRARSSARWPMCGTHPSSPSWCRRRPSTRPRTTTRIISASIRCRAIAPSWSRPRSPSSGKCIPTASSNVGSTGSGYG